MLRSAGHTTSIRTSPTDASTVSAGAKPPCRTGEIDLVMVDTDGSIVFVEVKTRADESFEPVESVITSAKKAKLSRTADYFLAAQNIQDRPCRFDFVTIVLGRKGPIQIRHYPNAFVP